MSGIAGLVRLDGAPLADLSGMVEVLRRRGPDDQRTWIDGSVALVHAALHTAPEITAQPFTLDGQTWISADARLDNRPDLLRALGAPPHVGDAELILRAYARWGEGCVDHLLGDFAFIVWNSRDKSLWCARDPLGVRLLYYYSYGGLLICASQVRAILAYPGVNRAIYEPRIGDYLAQALEGIDKTCTFYQHILRLPPGHTLTLRDGQAALRPYFELRQPASIVYPRDEDYVEAFRERFSEAVRCCLRAAQPDHAGAMLSGGLDSSSVAGVAREVYRQQGHAPLQTLSAVVPDAGDGETHFINAVIAQGNVRPIHVQPADLPAYADELDYLFDHADDLYDHWMSVPQVAYMAARARGIRVVLTGIGGDEFGDLPGAYPLFLLREGKFGRAWSELRGAHRFYSAPTTRPLPLLLRYLYHIVAPERMRRIRQVYQQKQQYQTILRENAINPDFAARIDLRSRLQQLWDSLDHSRCPTIQAAHLASVNHPFLTVGLERYNRVGAAYGVEARHPYMDRRLIEFLLAIPPEQLTRHGWPKFLARRAMAGILPDKVRWRRGIQHLGWRFQAAQYHLMKAYIRRTVKDELLCLKSYIDTQEYANSYYKAYFEINDRRLRLSLRWVTLAKWMQLL